MQNYRISQKINKKNMKNQVKLFSLLAVIATLSACKTTQVVQKSEITTETTKKEWIKTTLVEKDISKANTVEANFYIGITEVSQKEFETLMGFNPSEFIGENLPVENVTWYDAAMFCNKLSEKEGLEVYYQFAEIQKTENTISSAKVSENKQTKGYRLPTKGEWCYAAAGGPKSQNFKYSGSNTPGEVAWYKDNSEGKTQAVATKKANEIGLYDMSGNVYEWTNSGTSNKAFMGGAWAEKEYNVESKSDNYDKPENRSKYTGFRVARFAEIIAPDASAPEGIEFKTVRNYKDFIKEVSLPVSGGGFSHQNRHQYGPILVFNNYNNCTGNLDEQIENFKVNFVANQMGGNYFEPLGEKCTKTMLGDQEVYRFELHRRIDKRVERFGYIMPYEGGAVWVFMHFQDFHNSPTVASVEEHLAAKQTIDKVLDYVVKSIKFQ
jgi:formylglycine-generating enzyme